MKANVLVVMVAFTVIQNMQEKKEMKPSRKEVVIIETNEILQLALERDMIDLTRIQEQIAMQKRKEILDKHPYKIWEGKDGKWYTYIPDKNGRKLKKRSTRKEIEDVIIDYLWVEDENPTIREVFQEWNDRRLELHKISPATHTRNQQLFNRHYKKFGNRRIRSVTVDDFIDFLETQIPKYDLTAKAFANLKGITGGLIKRAKRRKLIDYLPDDVFNEIDTSEADFSKSIKTDEEEVFNAEETDQIVRYLIQNPDLLNLAILLLFVTGLRVGELVALQWQDYRPDAIFVRRTETRFQNEKGKWECGIKDFPKTEAGVRVVAIPQAFQWIADAIKKLGEDSEFVFVQDGVRLNTNRARKRLQKICDSLEIPRRSPHKIRKTYCSILFENNLDSKMITNQMGHTDIMCSEIYYHRSRKNLDDTIETISAIPEFKQKMTLIV